RRLPVRRVGGFEQGEGAGEDRALIGEDTLEQGVDVDGAPRPGPVCRGDRAPGGARARGAREAARTITRSRAVWCGSGAGEGSAPASASPPAADMSYPGSAECASRCVIAAAEITVPGG